MCLLYSLHLLAVYFIKFIVLEKLCLWKTLLLIPIVFSMYIMQNHLSTLF